MNIGGEQSGGGRIVTQTSRFLSVATTHMDLSSFSWVELKHSESALTSVSMLQLAVEIIFFASTQPKCHNKSSAQLQNGFALRG